VLSKEQVTADSPILVELIKRNQGPESRATVVITWPGHVTECTPAKLAEVVEHCAGLKPL